MANRLPQFVKMNAGREENPPLREVTCPDYRRCLNEAAYNNFCLDCSQCAEIVCSEDQLHCSSLGASPTNAARTLLA
jgi:hypothetical protein